MNPLPDDRTQGGGEKKGNVNSFLQFCIHTGHHIYVSFLIVCSSTASTPFISLS